MTLNCTYQTADSAPYLFWYVQHLNKALQLLLKGSARDPKPKSEGFQATLVQSDRSFHLQKRAVQASDSAVYYCALSDTVTQGCGGAEHKPRVQMGLWLWAALQGVLFLSPEYCQSTSSSDTQNQGHWNSWTALRRNLGQDSVKRNLSAFLPKCLVSAHSHFHRWHKSLKMTLTLQ